MMKKCLIGIPKNVIPTKVGIQNLLKIMDSGFRRNDKNRIFRGALIIILAIAFCGCASSGKFRYPPSRWLEEADKKPIKKIEAAKKIEKKRTGSGGIDEEVFSKMGDVLDVTGQLLDQVTSPDAGMIEAINVNNFDEVPDSTWFTNNIGRFSRSPKEIAAVSPAEGGMKIVKQSAGDYDEIIANRFLRAFGYNVFEKYIESNGRERLIVTKIPEGDPIGPFSFKGKRRDDPNDTVPHEHRRELRALKILCTLFEFPNVKGNNALDIFIEEGAEQGYVKHYVSGAIPIFPAGPKKTAKKTAEDYKSTMSALFSFGTYDPFWASIGDESARFSCQNQAFRHMTRRDAFWAAKILSRFSDKAIEEIVAEAKIADAEKRKAKVADLIKRREEIVGYWFARFNPVDNFNVIREEGRSFKITFDDISKNSSRHRYLIKTERKNFAIVPWTEVATAEITVTPEIFGKILAGKLYVIELQSMRRDSGRWGKSVNLFIKNDGGLKLLGLKRM